MTLRRRTRFISSEAFFWTQGIRFVVVPERKRRGTLTPPSPPKKKKEEKDAPTFFGSKHSGAHCSSVSASKSRADPQSATTVASACAPAAIEVESENLHKKLYRAKKKQMHQGSESIHKKQSQKDKQMHQGPHFAISDKAHRRLTDLALTCSRRHDAPTDVHQHG